MTRTLQVSALILLSLVTFLTATESSGDLVGHGGMVRAIDVSADGRYVISGSFDFTARLWDFSDQSEIAILEAHEGPVTSVIFLPTGKYAISTSDDKTAVMWDLLSKRPVRIFRGHQHKIMVAASTSDGKLIATGSWDKTIRIWHAGSGENLHSIKTPSPVNAIVFLSDNILASGHHDPIIRLWDVGTGEALGKLEGHLMGVTSLDVSPDRKHLLSASIDKTIRVWDTGNQKQIKEIKVHNSQVYAAKYSPDGKSALTAGKDGYVIHWDLLNEKPLREIFAHDQIVWAVDFAVDGQFAVSASSDDQARVWHLPTGDRIGDHVTVEDEPKPWLSSKHPGAVLFTKCARCHSLKKNGPKRSGPHLEGLFGRQVGSVPGYSYTKSLRTADFIWNQDTIFDLFNLGPDVFLPGTKMPLQKVTNSTQLMNLVQYLQEITKKE